MKSINLNKDFGDAALQLYNDIEAVRGDFKKKEMDDPSKGAECGDPHLIGTVNLKESQDLNDFPIGQKVTWALETSSIPTGAVGEVTAHDPEGGTNAGQNPDPENTVQVKFPDATS